MKPFVARAVTFATAMGLVVVAITSCCMKKEHQQPQHPPLVPAVIPDGTPPIVVPSTTKTDERSLLMTEDGETEEELMAKIKTKLVPHQFDFIHGTDKLSPHQFVHLHHMKTGGTSIDHLMKCAMSRLERIKKWEVPYFNIHECAVGSFKKCVEDGPDQPCRGHMNTSAIMSFCAPLKHLDTFGWTEPRIKSMTILRHPVDRVWSMFRFQTKRCYKCMNLTDIYENVIDADKAGDWSDLCLKQLQNHEVVNLLRKDFPDDATEDDMVEEAIKNMKNFFTVIGLTERLTETYELIGEVFPWMALKIEHSTSVCRLPHDNSSPKNNACIKDPNNPHKQGTHWDLPAHPDEATRKAIMEHNRMDMRLYEAAQQYFELQMRAAGMGEEA